MDERSDIPTQLDDTMQVLVLDDEPAVTAAVARQLQELPAHLHRCTSLTEARALCATQQIDVALIDHHLGKGSETGLDFLTRLASEHPHCFRIIFTAEADFDFVVDAINRGNVDGFLPKPWNDEQLRVLVRQGAQTAWLRQHNALLHEHLTEQNEQLNRFNAQLEHLVLERTGTLERMNRQLAETNKQLGTANQELSSYQQELVAVETQTAISQMVQGLAHELNNPLAVILGYAQRYQRRYAEDSQLHKCFRIIREEGERARTLISQLRRFAVRDADHPEPCWLGDAFAGASKRLQERHGRLLPCYLHGEDRQVLIGRRSLVQALEQILENANENAGTSRLDVTCRDERGRLHLYIDNDGTPPDEEAIHKAIKPFYTGKGMDHPGLGLSLASS
ncbi:MAG: response regulator, partial [Planctomycetota bacterium]